MNKINQDLVLKSFECNSNLKLWTQNIILHSTCASLILKTQSCKLSKFILMVWICIKSALYASRLLKKNLSECSTFISRKYILLHEFFLCQLKTDLRMSGISWAHATLRLSMQKSVSFFLFSFFHRYFFNVLRILWFFGNG